MMSEEVSLLNRLFLGCDTKYCGPDAFNRDTSRERLR